MNNVLVSDSLTIFILDKQFDEKSQASFLSLLTYKENLCMKESNKNLVNNYKRLHNSRYVFCYYMLIISLDNIAIIYFFIVHIAYDN